MHLILPDGGFFIFQLVTHCYFSVGLVTGGALFLRVLVSSSPQ